MAAAPARVAAEEINCWQPIGCRGPSELDPVLSDGISRSGDRRSIGVPGYASSGLKPKCCRAIRQASSPGWQARQTSGRTSYTEHSVATPTLPVSAEHRLPSHRMPEKSAAMKAPGMR